MVTFTIQNIFSMASRDRCMAKLRILIPLPNHGTPPSSSASVLVPLCQVNGVPSLLYTIRSSKMRMNTGHITFPGGKPKPDETVIQTALRKTREEIGLSPDMINVWGQGPAIPSSNNDLIITPVIGAIFDLKPDDLKININKVSEAFTVPIEMLCDPKNQFYTQFSNGKILPVFVVEDYKIWGITAYITHALLTCALSRKVYHNEYFKKKIDIRNPD